MRSVLLKLETETFQSIPADILCSIRLELRNFNLNVNPKL